MPENTESCRKSGLRAGLRSSTALSVALMLGAGALGTAGFVAVTHVGQAQAGACSANPCAADCAADCAANPCAADPCAANPCAADPCAADPCAANPCAADACAADPCAADPCAAACGPCGPCGPCGAAAGEATGCFIPRLAEANACAADPCAAHDPCAADPCAAHDPCAANACAADPCAAANPCAADDPCAAACAPCGPCGPCGPCAAGAPPPDVSDEELQALYDCLMESMGQQEAALDSDLVMASWTESERPEGSAFAGWTNFASTPYISFTHGERFATNHANEIAAEVYGLYEDIDTMPAGGIVAKPTFSIGPDGQALWETLFLMEKAEEGASPDTNDWIYTAIMPDGSLMGRTLGANSDGMFFCAACHMGGGMDTDDLLFMEPQYRVQD